MSKQEYTNYVPVVDSRHRTKAVIITNDKTNAKFLEIQHGGGQRVVYQLKSDKPVYDSNK